MKAAFKFCITAAATFCGAAWCAAAATNLAGAWLGTLNAGPAPLRVQFRITEAPGGSWSGQMDSPDQGASGIPVDSVTLKDNKARLEVKSVAGVYEGTLNEPGTKLTGQWQQGLATLPLTLERIQKPVAAPTLAGAETPATNFVSLLASGDFAKAASCFDAAMHAALSEDRLKQLWTDLLKEQGAFRKIERTRAQTFPPYRIVFVTCAFAREPAALKVVLNSADKVSGLFFVPAQPAEYHAPAYVKASFFQEKEVTVGQGEWELPGTLSVPAGKGPFHAVVLVHGSGSGAGDRDETIGPNKPFRDLAWGLASQGVAVLRYEKRTTHYSAKVAANLGALTVNEETVDDALAAISLLRRTEEIDPKKVFVLGHSLGGMMAPRIGSKDTALAGLIILAGAARPLEDLMLEQIQFQSSLSGKSPAEAQKQIEEVKQGVARVKDLSKTNAPKGNILGAPASYWLDLRGYNPPEAAKSLQQPMLILQGEKDCQVNPRLDFEPWRQAVGGRKNVTLKSYPKLNHLFMEVEGQSTGAEYERESHVAEEVVGDIAGWVKAVPRSE